MSNAAIYICSLLLSMSLTTYENEMIYTKPAVPPAVVSESLNTGDASTSAAKPERLTESGSERENTDMTLLKIKAGGKVFPAVLYNNDTAKTFAAGLPLTLSMSELNGNEKYCYMPEDMPSNPQNVKQINAGDLMLYGSDCVVLFYESSATSYSYTKLGYIKDVAGLEKALGTGSISVTFDMAE